MVLGEGTISGGGWCGSGRRKRGGKGGGINAKTSFCQSSGLTDCLKTIPRMKKCH